MQIENHNEDRGGNRTDEKTKGGGWADKVDGWPEPVDGRMLLDNLTETFRRFVVLPKCAAETLALWVLHTYAYELRDVTAYLGIESPEKRCGKTTLLGVLNALVNRPIAASNISSPAFFRVIEEVKPTLLIDEADTFLEGNDELRGILNSGYTRDTAFVVRVGFQDAGESAPGQAGEASTAWKTNSIGTGLARFSCWCPKVFAAIGGLPETLADRCIVIRMQRKTAREQCERLRELDRAETRMLRRKCARFVADHAEAIGKAKPPPLTVLNDRAADIWEPLLVLADLAHAEWAGRGREAARWLSMESRDDAPIGSLFMDILVEFVSFQGTRLFSRTLVSGLNACEDRPWMRLRKGKAIDGLWLARQLAPYGIHPRTVRIENATSKGYAEEDFTEAFRRYIPTSEIEALHEQMEAAKAQREEAASKEAVDGMDGTDETMGSGKLAGRSDGPRATS